MYTLDILNSFFTISMTKVKVSLLFPPLSLPQTQDVPFPVRTIKVVIVSWEILARRKIIIQETNPFCLTYFLTLQSIVIKTSKKNKAAEEQLFLALKLIISNIDWREILLTLLPSTWKSGSEVGEHILQNDSPEQQKTSSHW